MRMRAREKYCGWAVAFYLISDRGKEVTWADGLSTLLTNVNQKGKEDEDKRDRRRGEKIEAAGQPGGRNRKRVRK